MVIRSLLLAVLILVLVSSPAAFAQSRGTVIEDFESGSVELSGYPDQDHDPGAWELTTENVFGGVYALRVYGNSWKIQEIPPTSVTDSTVWQAAAFVERLGEMQALGLGDGTNELFYTFAGEELPQAAKWWTVYQGALPLEEWWAYLLPIGEDWHATHGYYPTITKLIYVNDDDEGQPGITIFDQIIDVTEDLPVAPAADILHGIESVERLSRSLLLVGVQFHGRVLDPDSDSHTFAWDFGDSTSSDEQDPFHEFLVEAEYTYTVGLLVRDPDQLAGHDTCQIQVEPGEGDLPFTVNFVGDIFTGRSYEYPGGIIDTDGIEALFEPTLPILGEAADMSVCNLECSYTDQGTPHPTKSVVFRSRPENIAGIRFAGIDVVDIANNHIVDYGEVGMSQTIDSLEAMGIGYSGAGVSSYFALQPTFRTESGVRLGFLGQCNRCGRKWNYQPFLDAGCNKPGFAYLLPHNLEAALAETGELADIVILQTHSGDEYETTPPERGREFAAPPPVEAHEIGPEDPGFLFPVEPSPGDRALRRMALDLGADVVINHHPHVLQGFESYNGKLIAHSLGNFIFDLYYPETMPTLVLTLEIDKEEIVGYRFTPAWIDDYIPHPATGRLGREIMDRMADYSRPMDALVSVCPGENEARIYLARSEADSLVTGSHVGGSLLAEDSYWISPPMELAGEGNLSRIVTVGGGALGGWEISWGREILWHGGFEPEGATFWDDNTPDEWLDETVAHSGLRSLALRRQHSDSEPVGTDLEKHLPSDPSLRHSFAGYLKAENAREACVMTRFYNNRYSGNPITSTDMGPRFTGTADWFPQWKNLDTPADAAYFEVRCHNEPPGAGTGQAWFDDLKFIEWEPWVPAESPIAVPSPNNYRFLQVRRADAGAGTVTVEYEETAYQPMGATVGRPPPVSRPTRLRNSPNPFSRRTTIELTLPGGGPRPVSVAVYDVRGRKIATLYRGELPGGSRSGLAWDGRDTEGNPVPAGIYFARACIGQDVMSRKLVLVQ